MVAARLIFISGDLLHRHWKSCKSTGERPFLEEPFDPAEIRRAAVTLLSTAPRSRDRMPLMFCGVPIVICDDEEPTREFLAELLTNEGSTVATVSSCAEMWRIVPQIHPDPVICDP